MTLDLPCRVAYRTAARLYHRAKLVTQRAAVASIRETSLLACMLIDRPKCWCVGLSRTGTTTIFAALRVLGYKAAHNPEFDELKSLEAGSDIGVTVFYKYLDYKYPGSKFILTLRDLDPWLESMKYIMDLSPVQSREWDLPILRRMLLYETVNFDRDKLIHAYHRHLEDVRRYFQTRPGDLLEMNLAEGDGWNKLCPFLGLPEPPVTFPCLNRRRMRSKSVA